MKKKTYYFIYIINQTNFLIMKKKVSLIVMAFMAISLVVKAALSFTETSEVYAVPEAFTPTDGQVVQATPSVKLTYGVDGQWKESVSNGFDGTLKYSVVGNNNPKDGELAGDPPTNSGNGYTEAKPERMPKSGTYYIFTPSKAGTITAGVKLGANKSIYVVDAADGTCLSSTIKVTDLEGNEQTLRAGDKANNINEYSLEAELKTAYVEFPVEAGKSYYLFCSGSKMAFWGFYFTPMSSSWNPSAGETLSAGTVLMDDDGMKATIPFASTVLAEQATIAGKSFDNAIQVRVTDLPSSTNPTGTEYTEKQSSSIVVEAKADIDLTLYYKRQPVNSSTYDENDSKDLKVYDQSSYNMLTGDFAIVGNDETGTYGYAAKRVPLEKGKTYVIAAKGTTVSFYGFSYEVREYTDPSASVLDLSSSSYEKTTVVLNRENVEKCGYLHISPQNIAWNEERTYGNYSGEFYNLTNNNRWMKLKAKGVSKFEVIVRSSSSDREYFVTVNEINFQERFTTQSFNELESSGEITTGYDGEIEIVLDGGTESVYPVAIILSKKSVPHTITTVITPQEAATFNYNVSLVGSTETTATSGETVKLTSAFFGEGYDDNFKDLLITTASGFPVEWSNPTNEYKNGVPVFQFTMPDEDVIVSAEFSERTKYYISPNVIPMRAAYFNFDPQHGTAGEETTVTLKDPTCYGDWTIDDLSPDNITVTTASGENIPCVVDMEKLTVTFTMPAENVIINIQFVKADPDELIIREKELTEGDISAAIERKAGGKPYKKLKVNLAAGGSYTISKPISAPGNVLLKGSGNNPATITMSEGMTGNLIELSATEDAAPKADGTASDHKLIPSVEITGVKIHGLQGALIRDTQKTLVEEVTISDAIVEMPAAGKNVLDFNSQGYVGKVVVKNTTFYATGKNTGFFAQYGSRPKNVNEALLQEFDVQNSTFVNIANGKSFNNLRQSGTAQNVYTLKNNIFVDCGKSGGEMVVGFNNGQTSGTPIWDVDGNVFNWNGEDTSEAEVTKAGTHTIQDATSAPLAKSYRGGAETTAVTENIVKNSIAGVVTFTDVANGDFGGIFTVPEGTDVPAFIASGDPRWTLTPEAAAPTGIEAIENGPLTIGNDAPAYNLAGQKVGKGYKGIVIKNGKKVVMK